MGVADTVRAIPAQQTPLLIDKAQKNTVNIRLELENEVTAPVSQGQRLGTMYVTAGEQVLTQIPMVAETAVSKLSWGQMFRRVLKSICLG